MQIKAPRLVLLLAAFAMPLLVSCDSGGTGANSTSPSGEKGEVTVKLKRSKMKLAKSVSSKVDSAFIRVWKSDVYNNNKYVSVPEPGNATTVSLQVPASTGYRAGVLAVESDSGEFDEELPYAVGTTGSTFEVTAGNTTNVSPTLVSLQPTVQLPSSVGQLEKDTVRVEIGRATGYDIDEFEIDARISTDPSFPSGGSDVFPFELADSTPSNLVAGLEVSGSDASTLYIQIGVDYGRAGQPWTEGTGGSLGFASYPNPDVFDKGSYEIPIGSTGDTGTVVITFGKNGERVRKVTK